MTLKTQQLGPDEARVYVLAPVIQRWAEMCKQRVQDEPGAALRWYLEGRADAHAMDAARIRECVAPSVAAGPPPGGVAFIRAYEALLEMMASMASTAPEVEVPE